MNGSSEAHALRALLKRAQVRSTKARESIRQIVDVSDPPPPPPVQEKRTSIYQALKDLSPALASSYAQVRVDLEDEERTSWAGSAHEIREMVATILRLLAPDDDVVLQSWYKQDVGTVGPTQKQRVKYILLRNQGGSKREGVLSEIDIIEQMTADLVRSTYSRASDAAHRMKGRAEARRIFRYFEAFAYDLLNLE